MAGDDSAAAAETKIKKLMSFAEHISPLALILKDC